MKRLILKYYPPLIFLYSIWILYMMFFAYNRGDSQADRYFIRPFPFQSIYFVLTSGGSMSEILKNIAGNIILFMPYGFLGIIYPALRNYKKLLLVFLLAINYLEFSQYFFQRGYAELDDVILNVSGMTLGYLIYRKIFIPFR